jgi:hypothetical protein
MYKGHTVQPRIFTARRCIDIPTIRTRQLDRVHPGHVGSAARDDVRGLTEYAGTDAEMGHFVLLGLLVSFDQAVEVDTEETGETARRRCMLVGG